MLLRVLVQNVARARMRIMRMRPVRYVNFWRRFYKMRRLGVPVLTLRMAARRGITNIYHLNKGVGDGLMFAGVAREYYKKTGVRPLLYVPQWHIFRYMDFCWYLYDWRMLPENYPADTKHTMDVFYKFYLSQVSGTPLRLSNGHTFNLCPLEYLKNVYVCGNTIQKLYGGFPKRGQICQWVANRMGIVGEIDVRPEIRLTEFEKDFGKFARGKIVIKCGGNGPYKYLIPKIAQGIIDELSGEYEFLQIGDFDDPVLYNAEQLFKLNLREFAGVLSHARLFVGAIGGMMHLARAVDCPAVILHGCEHDDFYYPSQRKVFSDNRCMECVRRCWWPDKDDERRCFNRYRCITDFNPKRVADIIRAELKRPRTAAATPDLFKCVGRMVDCNTSANWWLTLDDFFLDYAIPTPADECRVALPECAFDYDIVRPDGYAIAQISDMRILNLHPIASCHWGKGIVSDSPLLFRLTPRPSYFAYILKIAELQRTWTRQWHKEAPIDDIKYWMSETRPKNDYFTLEGYARINHMMNFFLWHQEDIVRRPAASDGEIAAAKRNIDRYNQIRNDCMEKMDETMLEILRPALPGAFKAPLNTETVGMIMDRLSIMALKTYHMAEAARRRGNAARCNEMLTTLKAQRFDLLESVKFLLVDYMNGARRPQTYRQCKMYNDPRLNPEMAK